MRTEMGDDMTCALVCICENSFDFSNVRLCFIMFYRKRCDVMRGV